MSDTGYLGNPLLKKSGTPIEWTPEMLKEYMKCANDPIYFAERYIKIVHVDHGFIPIKLYDYQKDIINAITNNRRVVANTSRQAGKCVDINTVVTIKIQENILNITMGELHEAVLGEKNSRLENGISRWDRIRRMFDLWIQVPDSSISSENTQHSKRRISRTYTNSFSTETKKQNFQGSISSSGLQKPIYWTRGSIVHLQQKESKLRSRETLTNSFERWKKLFNECGVLDEERVEFRRSETCVVGEAIDFFTEETSRETWRNGRLQHLEKTPRLLATNYELQARRRKVFNKQKKNNEDKLSKTFGRKMRNRRFCDSISYQMGRYWSFENWNNIERFDSTTPETQTSIFSSSSLEWNDCWKSLRNRTANPMGKPRYDCSGWQLRNISSEHENGNSRFKNRRADTTSMVGVERKQKNNVEEKDLYSKTDRKFVEVIDINGLKVLTPTGWHDVSKLNVTIPYRKFRVELDSGISIECADDHIFISDEGQIYAKDCLGKKLHTQNGLQTVSKVEDLNVYETMYDLSVESEEHVYYTNGILSHNTTTAMAVILHYILFNEYKTVALLANKAASALEILSRIQMAFEALPPWLQQGVVTWNKGSMELENGCKVIAAASSSSSIRGKSIAFLYIDETAFLNNWDEFFASVYPTISSGKETKILLTSTPNSLNHFWKICKEAQEDIDERGRGKNGYIYIEVTWDKVPGRDEAWKEDTLASIGWNMEQFQQEFCGSFIGSTNTLISGSKLKELSFSNPIFQSDGIYQYKPAEKGNAYALIVDVSRGKGLDYSTFSVLDITKMPYEQVCTFRDNFISPVDYASIIYRIGKLYNEASVLIEINDIGGQVADALYFDYGYENMLFTENAGRTGKRISAGFGKNVDRGIRTTKTVKAVGCSMLKLMVEQNQLIIHDFETIQELSRFSRRGPSYEAESGAHDDMVMTLVLFAWITDQNYFKDMTDIHTLAKLRERTEEEIDAFLLPFGFIDDGRDEPETVYVRTDNW